MQFLLEQIFDILKNIYRGIYNNTSFDEESKVFNGNEKNGWKSKSIIKGNKAYFYNLALLL